MLLKSVLKFFFQYKALTKNKTEAVWRSLKYYAEYIDELGR